MNILNTIIDKLGGSMISEGFKVVSKYFPPSMSEAEKKEAELAYERLVYEKQREASSEALEVEKEFNQRIKDLEGTAADLKAIPILGHIIIFVRGSQRPIWGGFTLFADYMTFSRGWDLSQDPELKSMLFAINVLVLGFLFGERAVKNVLPFIKEFLNKK